MNLPSIEDVIPTKKELMICMSSESDQETHIGLIQHIKQFNPKTIRKENNSSIDLTARITKTKDLETILEKKAISIDEFIGLLNGSNYQLDMFGFLPGFMYIDGLNERLAMPRKEIPSTKCPPNSLAIGGPYLGIYKYPSPAGWHIIGAIENLPELKVLHKFQSGSLININFIYEPID